MSDSRLLRNARRELFFILALWLAAFVWTVGVSYWMGYHRPPEEPQLILGMPAWVFFGVFVPWMLCSIVTVGFCLFFMTDDDLGGEAGENADA